MNKAVSADTRVTISKISLLLERLGKIANVNFVFRFTNTNWMDYLPGTQQEHRSHYCRRVKRKPNHRLKDCIIEHRENTIRRALELRKPFIMTCHAGITETVVPIFIKDRYFGAIFIGPFVSSAPPPYANSKNEYLQLPDFKQEKAEVLSNMVYEIVEMLKGGFPDDDAGFQLLPELKVSDQRIFQALAFMRENFCKRLTVARVAKHCLLSPSRFMHLFAEETGISFSDYIQRLRVNEAKRLLEVTQLSIGEIAFESGISSQSRLAVLFNRYYGKSPKTQRDSSEFLINDKLG